MATPISNAKKKKGMPSTDGQEPIKLRENKAHMLLSHTPGLDVKGDDKMIFGSTREAENSLKKV